jgi:hypothetical protein
MTELATARSRATQKVAARRAERWDRLVLVNLVVVDAQRCKPEVAHARADEQMWEQDPSP